MVEQLAGLLSRVLEGNRRVFVFFDAQVYTLHGPSVYRAVESVCRSAPVMVLPPGERTKSLSTVNRLSDYLLSEGVSRTDIILACGGGVLSDVVGYVASTILRGVRWGVVSTTLLGMVDAAIGGKTGINHRRGKNLIGSFWQPSFAVCDTDHLYTLPRRHVLAGMGEIVKYAGLAGGRMLLSLEGVAEGAMSIGSRTMARLIAGSVRYKADVVADDETERGRRMLLNLGHTYAHGIENAAGYGRLLHGEAVLIGLLAACELSVRCGAAPESKLVSYRSIIERYVRHIPYRRLDAYCVWEAMCVDKKRRGDQLRFVLLSAPGRPFIADAVRAVHARQALRAALRRYEYIGGSHATNTRG